MPPPNQKGSAPALGALLPAVKQAFTANVAFSFFINLMMLVPSIFMLQVYDRVVPSRNMTTLLMLSLVAVGLYVLSAALEWIRNRLLIRLGNKIESTLGKDVFSTAFTAQLAGKNTDVRQALSDLATLRQFLTGGRLQSFLDAPWTPIYILFAFILHPWIGYFTVASSIVLIGLTILTEYLTRDKLHEANIALQGANRFAGSQTPHIEAIHAMGMLGALSERWHIRHTRALGLQQQANDISSVTSAATRFFRTSLQSMGLALGAYLLVNEGLSGGAMIIISILTGRALAPVEGILGGLQSFESARSAYDRLRNQLNDQAVILPAIKLPRPKGELVVDALFACPPGVKEALIKGINFAIPAGSVLAIVGPSGSGKSTLARLLTGVWPPLRGSVRLDGSDVSKWNRAELGPWIGYLPQDVEVLEGTIADNIGRFGTIDSEKIIEAAKAAGIHEMVLKLPSGYDTLLGPGGIKLSGGQQQRLALARALYGSPPLLVLDEPNSNLDEQGERALMFAIRTLKTKGSTIVIISHRKNILSIADKLLVLRDGMAVAFGTPKDVQTQFETQIKSISSPSAEKLKTSN